MSRVESFRPPVDYWGDLGQPFYAPGGIDGLMKCPRCGDHTKDASKPLQTTELRKDNGPVGEEGLANVFERSLPIGESHYEFLTLEWMRCERDDCLQTVIRIHETTYEWRGFPLQSTNSWFLYPVASSNGEPAPPGVPEPIRRDYAEAGAILDISHQMSAVLARKIVSDLLKTYAKRTEKRLTAQIDNFLSQPGHPDWLASGLHHVREAADMAAHTQEDATEESLTVIDIDREEAEWTLDFVERMFDWFIVQPAKDEAIKARIEDKSARAGRRPFRRRDSGEATNEVLASTHGRQAEAEDRQGRRDTLPKRKDFTDALKKVAPPVKPKR